ncbi:PilZ domain-containing protein [Azomonas macrocytogenes]|uniref:PilZ domain-containing protein n=1 Tax=Azomonas macrocytogenes TaxID=69962 RepID=A0A839T574_AZOMA|nr:PilZ domain-containing protein [Azomonas macrocytogenes]MBB3104592.1 hypothetical protein [Azomonas macrocytogenes]
MTTQDTQERREYYRIEDRIALEILPVEAMQAELPPLFTLLSELYRLELESQPLLRQIGNDNRTLASYLTIQNKRFELLGRALAQELIKEISQPRDAVLSEGGISFSNSRPLPENQPVALKLLLLPDALALLLHAQVAYCRPRADGQYDIGAEFDLLTDAQRQLLARHIVKRQALERRLTQQKPQEQ